MTLPSFLEDQQESTQLLLALLNRATSGVFLWKAEADKVEWSPKLFETLGYATEEMSNFAGIGEMIFPDDLPVMEEALATSRASGGLYEVQLRIKNKAGKYSVFDVHGIWQKDNDDRDLLLGFLSDITEIEAARLEARRAAALFRAFFDNAPAAVYIKSRDQKHLYSNEAAAKIMGTTVEALLNKRGEEVFSDATVKQFQNTDEQVFDGKKTVVWTGEVENADGEQITILDTKFPVSDPETGDVMLGGFGIDVTRQHVAERALAQSQRLEAIGRLVAGVAHDFNNTLAVIQGSVELLGDPRRADSADQLREDAIAAVQRGTQLTNQLLAFARESSLETETVNLNQLLQDMDRMFRRILPESIQIETVTGGGLWATDIDLTQAENALLNLALNARDAMPNGGRLTIETSNLRIDPEYIDDRSENLEPGRYVLLAVTDTGAGMSPEVLEQAFNPFFTTKPFGKGSGMGLAMVYGLMRQFNGSARIYSEEGVGTTVKLMFPASENEQVSKKQTPRAKIEGGSERVLLVEDDERLRAVLERQLLALGYHVTTAKSGDAALDLLELGLDIDLMVTDIVMPGSLMGTHLAKRARGLLPSLPVVFMSGYPADANVHGNGLNPGDIILMKPVPLATLSTQLRRALDGRPAS